MLFVVLRSGKVLQYNAAMWLEHRGQSYILRTEKWTAAFLADIPFDVVERIEPGRPCRVMRERPLRDRAKY